MTSTVLRMTSGTPMPIPVPKAILFRLVVATAIVSGIIGMLPLLLVAFDA